MGREISRSYIQYRLNSNTGWTHRLRTGDNSERRRSADMTEPTIVCPKCNNEIRLTESLAAPLIAATRQQFERQLSEKDADIARREQGVRERERQVLEGRRALDQQVQTQVEAQLKLERARVVAEESRKAKFASSAEMEAKVRELAELQEVLKSR